MSNSKFNFYKIYTSETDYILKKQDKNDPNSEAVVITEEDKDYRNFIKKNGNVDVIPYNNIEKENIKEKELNEDDKTKEDDNNEEKRNQEEIIDQKLLETKKNKLIEIKNAWKNAENIENCNTKLKCVDGEDLVIQYSAYDREIWNKKIIGLVMEMLQNNKFEIISNSYIPLHNTMQITELEATDISIGHIPARVYLIIKNHKINIKDAFNKFHEITIETMLSASIAQNLKVEQDLYKKWLLEKKVFEATNIEEVNLIHW